MSRHRIFSLFKTFSLPKPKTILQPILHTPKETSPACDSLLKKVRGAYENAKKKEIIFLHLDARSSQYLYPYANELAEKLLERGHVVVSATPISPIHPACFVIDIKAMTIMDTFMFLKLLNQEIPNSLRMITVTSVFGSVSAALGVTNIQMWHIGDEVAHTMWYPNIYILTAKDYPAIPEDHVINVDEKNYSINKMHQFDYNPDFVLETAFKIFGTDASFSRN